MQMKLALPLEPFKLDGLSVISHCERIKTWHPKGKNGQFLLSVSGQLYTPCHWQLHLSQNTPVWSGFHLLDPRISTYLQTWVAIGSTVMVLGGSEKWIVEPQSHKRSETNNISGLFITATRVVLQAISLQLVSIQVLILFYSYHTISTSSSYQILVFGLFKQLYSYVMNCYLSTSNIRTILNYYVEIYKIHGYELL